MPSNRETGDDFHLYAKRVLETATSHVFEIGV
jgi:hypothetical protein